MGMVTDPYHSARLPELQDVPAADPKIMHRIGGSVAFVHALGPEGLPAPYSDCDVIYTEMAWRAGYDTFMQRAGQPLGGFWRYAETLGALAARSTVPFYLVTGKAILKRLPVPTLVVDGSLRKWGCVIAVFGPAEALPANDTMGLLGALAERHARVGDPCCGYGTTGRVFAGRGKTFVMSDINPRCIGHIAAHAPGWGRR